jgi:hypothetical protein
MSKRAVCDAEKRAAQWRGRRTQLLPIAAVERPRVPESHGSIQASEQDDAPASGVVAHPGALTGRRRSTGDHDRLPAPARAVPAPGVCVDCCGYNVDPTEEHRPPLLIATHASHHAARWVR